MAQIVSIIIADGQLSDEDRNVCNLMLPQTGMNSQ